MKYTFIKKFGIVAALLSATLSASAYDFETGGLYYNILSEEERTAEVTFSKKYVADYKGDITIPQICSYDGKEYNVVSIGESAFYLCSDMTSVSIPGSVTAIGDRAFVSCKGLTDITIPGAVQSIDDMAFSQCIGLTSVNIPASVTSIGEAIFADCGGLISITVDNDNPAYSSIDGILYDKLQTNLICCPCGKADEIRIPDSVTSIANQAFRSCHGLISLTLPNSVTSIGVMAFLSCGNLKSIDLSTSLSTIGMEAFSGCRGLTSVSIPASVTDMVGMIFGGCLDLTGIEVDSDNPSYSSVDGILYNKSQTEMLFCPVGKTGNVIIPGTVTTIMERGFESCDRLSSITIPNSVTVIGNRAFSDCTGLSSITIPGSVTAIGNYAFNNCFGLRSIYVEWGTPITNCSNKAFGTYNQLDATLYVPRGCVDAYKDVEPWSRFLNIEESNFVTGIDAIGCDKPAFIRLFNAAGVNIYNGPSDRIPALPRGLYIAKIGKTTTKLFL